jgi:hypothetical protein
MDSIREEGEDGDNEEFNNTFKNHDTNSDTSVTSYALHTLKNSSYSDKSFKTEKKNLLKSFSQRDRYIIMLYLFCFICYQLLSCIYFSF